jgi:hypothetical protein
MEGAHRCLLLGQKKRRYRARGAAARSVAERDAVRVQARRNDVQPDRATRGAGNAPEGGVSDRRVLEILACTHVDQTEARDAEDQKLRNRSLEIGPLIVCPDGAR